MTEDRKSDEKYCFSCGKILHNSALSCPNCGADQQDQTKMVRKSSKEQSQIQTIADQIFCRHCSASIHSSAPYCPECGGVNVSGISGSYTGGIKSHMTAGILALVLGSLGVHKFYCGKIGLGILYLRGC